MTSNRSTSIGNASKDFSQRNHRRLIGVLGFFLPYLLYGVAGIRPTEPLPPWALLPSISAYYYTGAIGIFVGVLFALSLFLFTYQGYKDVIVDRLIGGLGGLAALGVALFPTEAPDGLPEPSWWIPGLNVVHYMSAVTLFGSFILFAIWLFRKSSVPKGQNRPTEKRRRDSVCLICGMVMIACVIWTAISKFADKPIFWPEAIAIEAFAVSWLAKGEAHHAVLGAIRFLREKVMGK
jgi:hypothetical protein